MPTGRRISVGILCGFAAYRKTGVTRSDAPCGYGWNLEVNQRFEATSSENDHPHQPTNPPRNDVPCRETLYLLQDRNHCGKPMAGYESMEKNSERLPVDANPPTSEAGEILQGMVIRSRPARTTNAEPGLGGTDSVSHRTRSIRRGIDGCR